MRRIEDIRDFELMHFAGQVLYYVGIHPKNLTQKLDVNMPVHETVGGIRMALRSLFDEKANDLHNAGR